MGAVKTVLGSVIVGIALLGASGASAAGSPAGGVVKLFTTQIQFTNPSQPILVIGTVGGSGTAVSIDRNGKTDPNGSYVDVKLPEGTFEINAVALGAKLASLKPSFVGDATCSGMVSGVAPITLFDGTGLYHGISGTLAATVTGAFLLPRYTAGKHKGQCNGSNSAQPASIYTSISATGSVRFR